MIISKPLYGSQSHKINTLLPTYVWWAMTTKWDRWVDRKQSAEHIKAFTVIATLMNFCFIKYYLNLKLSLQKPCVVGRLVFLFLYCHWKRGWGCEDVAMNGVHGWPEIQTGGFLIHGHYIPHSQLKAGISHNWYWITIVSNEWNTPSCKSPVQIIGSFRYEHETLYERSSNESFLLLLAVVFTLYFAQAKLFYAFPSPSCSIVHVTWGRVSGASLLPQPSTGEESHWLVRWWTRPKDY